MHILITNDDGYLAPGLKSLAEELAQVAQISVVAPDRNKSGASNSLTLTRPLRVERSVEGYYAVDGTPTDCVHLALNGLLDDAPDMVVSGINAGPNLGDDVLYSGSVAGVTSACRQLRCRCSAVRRDSTPAPRRLPGASSSVCCKIRCPTIPC